MMNVLLTNAHRLSSMTQIPIISPRYGLLMLDRNVRKEGSKYATANSPATIVRICAPRVPPIMRIPTTDTLGLFGFKP